MTVPSEVKLDRHTLDLDDNGHDIYGSAASAITITDAGSYFTAADVEAALQELAAKDLGYTAHGNTGSTETFSALTGWHSATLNANCTFTFSGATSGLVASMVLELLQDGTGSRLVTWPGSVVWAGGTAPTLSTTAGHVDVILFMSRDGGSTWYGFPTGGSSAPFATPAVVLGTAAAAGAASTGIRSDSTIVAFDATVPTTQAFSDAAATGSAAVAARRDHKHGMPATPTSGIGGHAHVVSEAHLSNGSTTLFTLDQAFEDGSVIAWNTTTLARLSVTETQPDKATVSAAGTTGDTIMFDYAATVV